VKWARKKGNVKETTKGPHVHHLHYAWARRPLVWRWNYSRAIFRRPEVVATPSTIQVMQGNASPQGLAAWRLTGRFYQGHGEGTGDEFACRRSFRYLQDRKHHDQPYRLSVSRSIFRARRRPRPGRTLVATPERRTRSATSTRTRGPSSGRSYAAEPDVLIKELAGDEAIKAADTFAPHDPEPVGCGRQRPHARKASSSTSLRNSVWR